MNQEAFPKDLASPQYTLLIMKWDKNKGPYSGPKWEKAIAKTSKQLEELAAGLKYSAIAVTTEDLNSGKYDDVSKYRYVLQCYDEMTKVTTRTTTAGHYVSESDTYMLEMYFTDRMENKEYPSTKYQVASYVYGVKLATAHYQ